ncbi:MAG: iron chelate uptake ABC transporter family permease subunit [Actinomycetales bacterium]
MSRTGEPVHRAGGPLAGATADTAATTPTRPGTRSAIGTGPAAGTGPSSPTKNGAPPLRVSVMRPRSAIMAVGAGQLRPGAVLAVLLLMALAGVLFFCLFDLRGNWQYALQLRSRQVGALVVVGVAVGASSLVFQTVAGNRVLTPGVMGFDSLYLLIQTVLIVVLGTGAFLAIDSPAAFALNVLALTGFGAALFGLLLRRGSRDLFVLVLVGMVLGTVFASLTSLASRILTPDDYLTLQDVMFASFAAPDTGLLLLTGLVTTLAVAALFPLSARLDVVELGHDLSVSLGVGYRSTVLATLGLVTVLVATSTALVGPMTFLGLIVACLARAVMPTARHRLLIPAGALVGVICTVTGQFVVVRLFGYATTLSVVVNLAGGCYVLMLLMRAGRRG